MKHVVNANTWLSIIYNFLSQLKLCIAINNSSLGRFISKRNYSRILLWQRQDKFGNNISLEGCICLSRMAEGDMATLNSGSVEVRALHRKASAHNLRLAPRTSACAVSLSPLAGEYSQQCDWSSCRSQYPQKPMFTIVCSMPREY